MNLNLSVLVVGSIIQLALIVWHMFKYRGKKVAGIFILSGLIFGITRSYVIHFIQLSTNNSLLPYQLKHALLQIGNDSLQVYVGWIIAAYYAWCLAEMIIKKQNKLFKTASIPAIISVCFVVIASFSYMIETTANYMGWWSWNSSLESNFATSLFVNVPWVGIVDWATVAFEFLGVFLLTRYAIVNKKPKYMFILLFPIIHWCSHINFGNFYWTIFGVVITVSILVHILIPIVAAFVSNLKSPGYKLPKYNYTLVWLALAVSVGVCLISDIFVGKDFWGLLSLVPMALIILFAIGVNYLTVFYGTAIFLVATIVTPVELLEKKRIAMAFFPVIYLALIQISGKLSNLIKRLKSHQRLSLLAAVFLIVSLIGVVTFIKPGVNTQTNTRPNKSLAQSSGQNFILITLDTVRYDHTGLANYFRDTTPNLDKLAKGNASFDHAYTPIPFTIPAHESLLTGLYPKSLGIINNSSRPQISPESLANLFNNAGYSTAAFVSLDLLTQTAKSNNFNLVDGPVYDSKINKDTVDRSVNSNITNDKTLKWLDNNSKSPFFLWVHYYDAHSPYDTYCSKSYSLGKQPDHIEFKDGQVHFNTSIEPTANDYDYLTSRYDEEIACQDKQFGALIDKVKSLGIYDNTSIIVVGDHGENFDHKSVFHGSNLYEGVLRVPMVIKMKNFSTINTERNVSLVDIYDTVVNNFGLSTNGSKNDGIDLQSDTIAKRPAIYFQTKPSLITIEEGRTVGVQLDTLSAVLVGNLKLIAQGVDKPLSNYESYDVLSDPQELMNNWDINNKSLNSLQSYLVNFLAN